MYKDKKFILFIGALFMVLGGIVFPVSFENNDDHILYFISSGALSGQSSPDLILSSVWWGKLLCFLFSVNDNFNWYTFLLMVIQTISFLIIGYTILSIRPTTELSFILLWLFILSGFAFICTLKIQFTTVALIAALSVLLCIQFLPLRKTGWILCICWMVIALLLRRETMLFVLLFSVPVALSFRKDRKPLRPFLFFILITLSAWAAINYSEPHRPALKAFDQIAAKPTQYTAAVIEKTGYTAADISLIQSWYPGDHSYADPIGMPELAEHLSSHRNSGDILKEWKKAAEEERFMLVLWTVAFILCYWLLADKRKYILLIAAILIVLILYLTLYSRIPHRVIFPVLMYVVLLYLLVLFSSDTNKTTLRYVALFLLLLSGYKVYSSASLINIQSDNHRQFASYQQVLSNHPSQVFISAYGAFPVEYMNAWTPPKNLFPHRNLILTGWYCYTEDYRHLLRRHQLTDITGDIVRRDDILIWSNEEFFEPAFKDVLQQRYDTECHFESAEVAGIPLLKRVVANN